MAREERKNEPSLNRRVSIGAHIDSLIQFPSPEKEAALIESSPVYVVGVAGGTASGKTSVCRIVKKKLNLGCVHILSLDSFYRPLTDADDPSTHNFDHPNSLDWPLIISTIQKLKKGISVHVPVYDFKTHRRLKETVLIEGAEIILFEGILTLSNPMLLNQLDLKVFVKEDDDIRLIRRIRRDMKERARTLDSVLSQYQLTVKPSYDLFCVPTQKLADLIIPRGKSNIAAISILVSHIRSVISKMKMGRGKSFSIEMSPEKGPREDSDDLPPMGFGNQPIPSKKRVDEKPFIMNGDDLNRESIVETKTDSRESLDLESSSIDENDRDLASSESTPQSPSTENVD